MSVFHKLLDENGTNPFRFASCPTVIPVQVPDCARAVPHNTNRAAKVNASDCFLISSSVNAGQQLKWVGWKGADTFGKAPIKSAHSLLSVELRMVSFSFYFFLRERIG